jgi:hypothetical protein
MNKFTRKLPGTIITSAPTQAGVAPVLCKNAASGTYGTALSRTDGESTYLTQEHPTFWLLNNVIEGPSGNQRIGDAIRIRNIFLRLKVEMGLNAASGGVSSYTNEAQDDQNARSVRLMLIWDESWNNYTWDTTGTPALITDAQLAELKKRYIDDQADNSNVGLGNRDNRGQFRVLMDKMFTLPGTTAGSSCVRYIKKWFNTNLRTTFSDEYSTGVEFDADSWRMIEKGALILMAYGGKATANASGTVGLPYVSGFARIGYEKA